jgi:hypothetical protein
VGTISRRQWIVAIDTTYHASVSEQMENLIVASYKENPKVRLQPDQSAEWLADVWRSCPVLNYGDKWDV